MIIVLAQIKKGAIDPCGQLRPDGRQFKVTFFVSLWCSTIIRQSQRTIHMKYKQIVPRREIHVKADNDGFSLFDTIF